MKTVHAVYEHGVFRPLQGVELPEHTEVEFEPKVISRPCAYVKAPKEIYSILSERYETGVKNLAARHDEHQP
jgi:predicted DNA-binding antitoxin AbrB/MazE fold protein